MTLTDRNARIEAAADLVPWQARRFPRLPAGVSTDDLESAGHEALVHAATAFDPDARGGAGWRTYARVCVRNAMRAVIRHARTRRRVPLEADTPDGPRLLLADPAAADPAAVAAARELVAPPPRRGRPPAFADLPSPQAVAAQAVALRDAMYAAVSAADVGDIMRAMVAKAKGGDLKAARLLLDTVLPGGGKGGTTIQQVVAVTAADIG